MQKNKIKWEKLGLIFAPNTTLSWQTSHAALPTRWHLGGSQYRIFFSSRDKDNRAHVGAFDIDLNNPLEVCNISSTPKLGPGEWGMFDDQGVQACSIVAADNGDIYMYYLGWNTAKKEPLFYTSIGLAISKDGGSSFVKFSSCPILQRSEYDPWMVSGGTVIRRGPEWIMYYLSGFRFDFTSPTPTSWYDIKIARSSNGIDWVRSGEIALPLRENETNISRMSIIQNVTGSYRSWFPLKSNGLGYRCGYAESEDGIIWERREGFSLDISPEGWDSEAIDKMEVIQSNGKLYMLYNGNKFGFDGIGLAIAVN